MHPLDGDGEEVLCTAYGNNKEGGMGSDERVAPHTVHTTSSYLCILLLHTCACYFFIPVHTTSSYLYILLLHTSSYYFFIPVHTTSSYLCILLLHTCAYYLFIPVHGRGSRPMASGGRARPHPSLSECCLPPPIHPPSGFSRLTVRAACSGFPSSMRQWILAIMIK